MAPPDPYCPKPNTRPSGDAGRHPASGAYGCFSALFNAGQLASLLLIVVLAVAAGPVRAAPATILAFGDSLTAGYGLAEQDGFTRQLERALQDAGHDVVVRNAGVSGDTTAGGLARLAWTLNGPIDLVIVELGGNDGLRGIDPDVTRANLDAILSELNGRNIPLLFTGMRAPPNLGRDYTQAFDGLFAELADKYKVAFYPFFLDGVAAQAQLNQDDGLHPNADGVAVIVERIVPYVLDVLNAN